MSNGKRSKLLQTPRLFPGYESAVGRGGAACRVRVRTESGHSIPRVMPLKESNALKGPGR